MPHFKIDPSPHRTAGIDWTYAHGVDNAKLRAGKQKGITIGNLGSAITAQRHPRFLWDQVSRFPLS